MTTPASSIRRYSPWSGSLSGSTGTGLDQLIGWLGRDPGLRGSTDAASLAAGIAAADALNQLIATGLASIGRSSALVLTPADLIALNIWIRSDPARLQAFINAHGDDEGDAEQASTAWSTTAPVSCFTATTSSIRSSIPFTTSAFKSMPQATFSMKMVTPTLLCKWSRSG